MGTNSSDNSILEVINLLSDLVVFNQYDFNQFLKQFMKVIIKIVPTDSCLIYFYDQHKKEAVLIGSGKPHEEEIGQIIMKQGEGITTWVAEYKQTVAIEEKAYQDKRFKFFKELPEDRYESFLSVPIMNDTGVVGVINLQNRQPMEFTKEQIMTIESLVKIIASAFTKIVLERKVTKLENQLEERKIIERAKGVLMKVKNIPEDKAFAFLRTEAMNKRKTMKEIAEAVLLVWQ